MAASTVVSLPSALLFVLFQRYLVSGFLSGAVRGGAVGSTPVSTDRGLATSSRSISASPKPLRRSRGTNESMTCA
jgi:hypothetical protein